LMRTFARYAQATNSHTVVRLVANKKVQPCGLS